MKKIAPLLTLIVSLSFPTIANTQNTDWIFCMVTDDLNSSVYFSDVFHGNYDNLEAYQTHFREHIRPILENISSLNIRKSQMKPLTADLKVKKMKLSLNLILS